MNIAQREQQIIRIQSQSSYASINEALESTLRLEANRVTQIAVESALDEEVQAYLSEIQGIDLDVQATINGSLIPSTAGLLSCPFPNYGKGMQAESGRF
ncbi:hypothetical protein [Acaryochloris sp. CCMEE 5410]|uniref:hypothetical protein n=1 Tax=Acaryochloris sp. CCMEE 5410 TaxID=310037 RepID=UPI0021D3C130|nr:hypothetical protein [Acaryochloris sp. CCMEE 5410]